MCIAVFKFEGHSPVSADPDCVPPFILSLQGMEVPSGQIHIRNVHGGVQRGQLVTQLVLMVGIDAPGIAATAVEEFLQPLVPDAFASIPIFPSEYTGSVCEYCMLCKMQDNAYLL